MEEIELKLLTRGELNAAGNATSICLRYRYQISALEDVLKEMAAGGWYDRFNDNGPPFCTWCHNSRPLHTPSCPITRLQTAGIIEV